MTKYWKPVLLLATIGVMVIGMLGSGAWFTDTATSDTAEIYSGKLSIANEKVSTLELGTLIMAPGDITNEAVIIIENNGNLNLAWFGDLQLDGPQALKDAIYIDYAKMEFLSPDGANWQAEGPDNFILNGVGSGLYPTAYNAVAPLGPFPQISLDDFDGGNFMGVHPYEFNGALKPDYSYRLTLKFGFAPQADNYYAAQGPLTVKLVVNATQINEAAINASNPGNTWTQPALVNWLNAQIADQEED
jgi:hypothetical protein